MSRMKEARNAVTPRRARFLDTMLPADILRRRTERQKGDGYAAAMRHAAQPDTGDIALMPREFTCAMSAAAPCVAHA